MDQQPPISDIHGMAGYDLKNSEADCVRSLTWTLPGRERGSIDVAGGASDSE